MSFNWKKFVVISVLAIVFAYFYNQTAKHPPVDGTLKFLYNVSVTNYDNGDDEAEAADINHHKNWKLILYWVKDYNNPMSKRHNFRFNSLTRFRDERLLKEERCPYWQCEFTYNRRRLAHADAVLFSREVYTDARVIKRANQNQRWVYLDVEAAPGTPTDARYFNWTLSYGRDADVMENYGYFMPIDPTEQLPAWRNLMQKESRTYKRYMEAINSDKTLVDVLGDNYRYYMNKTKLIAWMSSHCGTSSKREQYVHLLQQYIQVDTYGRCGNYSCYKISPRSEECWIYVFQDKYMFYLSMENSFCLDYITEKLYNPLVHGIVPVVYGGPSYDHYTDYLPPDSYINAREYHPRDLAALLIKLSKDPEAYGRYHMWRGYWKVYTQATFCHLCTKLHTDNSTKYYTTAREISNERRQYGKCFGIKGNMFENGLWESKVYLPRNST